MHIGQIIAIFSTLIGLLVMFFAFAKNNIFLVIISIIFLCYLGKLASGPIFFGFKSNYTIESKNLQEGIKNGMCVYSYEANFIFNTNQSVKLTKLSAWLERYRAYYPYYYFYTGKLEQDDNYYIIRLDNLKDAFTNIFKVKDLCNIKCKNCEYDTGLKGIDNSCSFGIKSTPSQVTFDIIEENTENDNQVFIGTIILTKR